MQAPPCSLNMTGPPCACKTGYVPNPAGAGCVLPACPDHATRNPPDAPCACDADYKFDAAGTSCILEQYTISLSGLGGVVMPSKTLAAYAQVATSTGTLKSGIQVTLALTVEPENDGQLYSAHVGTVSPNGGATDANGKLSFEFRAPVAGGTHTITATCAPNCTNQATGTIKVPGCPIPPLTALTDPVAIDFDNNVGSRWRPDGLTPDFQAHLACVEAGITAAGGTSTGTSAYRPEQYQRHLSYFPLLDSSYLLQT